MEQERFEAALRALNGGATRRRGLAAAIRARAAGAGVGAGIVAAGPCGTSPGENACRNDSDCCTGICKITKSGRGRCRCVKVGKPCETSANCCPMGGEPMACRSKTCLAT
ncbi:MAG: hypothetical protein ACKOWF_12970 [Chloroflexota bacterium]